MDGSAKDWLGQLSEAVLSLVVGGLFTVAVYIVRFSYRFSDLEEKIGEMHRRNGARLEEIMRATEDLVKKHEDPERAGFGTQSTNEKLDEIALLLRDIRQHLEFQTRQAMGRLRDNQ